MDYDSTVNQTIKRKFVDRELGNNLSSLMEGQKGWETGEIFDEIENFYSYPELSSSQGNYFFEGGSKQEHENFLNKIEDKIDDHYSKDDVGQGVPELSIFLHNLKIMDSEPQDILEWWGVTEWFAEKLKAQGEPIYDSGTVMVWGRTCSGQHISLDGVISQICSDMGILEGQDNSWAPVEEVVA